MIVIGQPGRQPGQFSKPRAVAFAANDEMVVVDRTGRVMVHDARDGSFLRQWRFEEYENGTPTGITVDPTDNTLWLADTHYSRILQYNMAGERLRMFGVNGEGPGEMIFPTDATPDPDGETIWVTEFGRGNRVMQFTREGRFIREFGTPVYENDELERPMALVLSPDARRLYVVDCGNGRINVYTREGELLFRFGSDRMRYPLDLALGPDGLLYVVEYQNSRISRYTLEGEFVDSAGGPGRGPGEFFLPWGVAVAPSGKILVADTNNQRLQLLTEPDLLFGAYSKGTGAVASASAPEFQ